MPTISKTMRNYQSSPASAALGKFLRAMRSRTQPGSVGITSAGQRRVPGLRREELAQLAGVGVVWYTWLEQGRDINVSSDVLERLYSALSLTQAEREHLFALAHNRPPPNTVPNSLVVSPSSAALLGRLPDAAYIANKRWDVLAWNAAAAVLFSDLASSEGHQPNMIRFLFDSPVMRALHVNWNLDARVSLEKFRMDYWSNRTDPSFAELVDELEPVSSEFRRWWTSPLVHPVHDGVKTFCSKDGKPTPFSYSVLNLSENQNQRLVVFSPFEKTPSPDGISYAASAKDGA